MSVMSREEIRAADIEWANGFDIEDLFDAMDDSGVETADGCWVEHDGVCPHGHRSPFRVLGVI